MFSNTLETFRWWETDYLGCLLDPIASRNYSWNKKNAAVSSPTAWKPALSANNEPASSQHSKRVSFLMIFFQIPNSKCLWNAQKRKEPTELAIIPVPF